MAGCRFFNILADSDVREGLKAFSDWPTFPQLYTDGELIGGLDIVRFFDMIQDTPRMPHLSSPFTDNLNRSGKKWRQTRTSSSRSPPPSHPRRLRESFDLERNEIKTHPPRTTSCAWSTELIKITPVYMI